MKPDLDVSKLQPDETRPAVTVRGRTLVPLRKTFCEGCVAWEPGLDTACAEVIQASGTRCGPTPTRPSVIWVVPAPEMLERHAVARAQYRLES